MNFFNNYWIKRKKKARLRSFSKKINLDWVLSYIKTTKPTEEYRTHIRKENLEEVINNFFQSTDYLCFGSISPIVYAQADVIYYLLNNKCKKEDFKERLAYWNKNALFIHQRLKNVYDLENYAKAISYLGKEELSYYTESLRSLFDNNVLYKRMPDKMEKNMRDFMQNPSYLRILKKHGEEICLRLLNLEPHLQSLLPAMHNLSEYQCKNWVNLLEGLMRNNLSPGKLRILISNQELLGDWSPDIHEYTSLIDNALRELPEIQLHHLCSYSLIKKDFLIQKKIEQREKEDKEGFFQKLIIEMESRNPNPFCKKYTKKTEKIRKPRINEIAALRESIKERKETGLRFGIPASYKSKFKSSYLVALENYVEVINEASNIRKNPNLRIKTGSEFDARVLEILKKKYSKRIKNFKEIFYSFNEILENMNFLMEKNSLSRLRADRKKDIFLSHHDIASNLLEIVREDNSPFSPNIKHVLESILEERFTHTNILEIGCNKYPIDNVVNRLGEEGLCIFGNEKARDASLLYNLDKSVDLLAINALNEKKNYIDTVGMTVLAEAKSLENNKKVLVVDAFDAVLDKFEYGPPERLFISIYAGILGLAQNRHIDTIFVNASHSNKRTMPLDFMEFLAKQAFGENSEGGEWKWEREQKSVKFKLLQGVSREPRKEGLPCLEHTHYLEKEPLKENKELGIGPHTEMYFETWFRWNKHILDTYEKWPEEMRQRFPYTAEKMKDELKHPQWNLGRGYAYGFEIDVKKEIERLSK